MSMPLDELLADFTVYEAASEQALEAAERGLACRLPDDYRAFLLIYNGGEGFVGRHYLVLWQAEQLVRFNQGYEVPEYAPGFVMFGSTGGGDGFAFDTRTSPYPVVEVPFIGMSLKDGFPVADSFTRLLERMIQTEGSLF